MPEPIDLMAALRESLRRMNEKKPSLPRSPVPKPGRAHKVKRGVPHRKRKHKGREGGALKQGSKKTRARGRINPELESALKTAEQGIKDVKRAAETTGFVSRFPANYQERLRGIVRLAVYAMEMED